MKYNIKWLNVGILSLLTSIGIVSAQGDYGCGMMGNWMVGGYGSGMMFLGWITYLLVIALIIAGIYWLIKNANRKK